MRLSRRCYAVTGLGYSPPWCVNAGIVAGDRLTLIVDTGGNALAAQTIHGYALAIGGERPLRAINTEQHFDHIGGNHYFAQQGVESWGHAGIRRSKAEFQEEIQEFNGTIPNAARRRQREAAVFFWNTEAVNPQHRITEDIVFDLGDCRAEVLLTPGHTPTNLSVWLPDEGVLYTGDCLIHSYLPNLDAGGPADWEKWLLSLARLRRLQPEVVVAGHGPVAKQAEVAEMFATVQSVLETALSTGRSPTADHPV